MALVCLSSQVLSPYVVREWLTLATGLKVEGAILERLGDKVLEMVWRPMHEGSLQNEFRCWANYKSPALLKSNS